MFYNIVFVVNKVDIEFDSLSSSGALGVGNLTIIGFQIITNAGISLIGPLSIIQSFSLKIGTWKSRLTNDGHFVSPSIC